MSQPPASYPAFSEVVCRVLVSVELFLCNNQLLHISFHSLDAYLHLKTFISQTYTSDKTLFDGGKAAGVGYHARNKCCRGGGGEKNEIGFVNTKTIENINCHKLVNFENNKFGFIEKKNLKQQKVNEKTRKRMERMSQIGSIVWLLSPWVVSIIQAVVEFVLDETELTDQNKISIAPGMCFVPEKNFVILGFWFSFLFPSLVALLFLLLWNRKLSSNFGHFSYPTPFQSFSLNKLSAPLRIFPKRLHSRQCHSRKQSTIQMTARKTKPKGRIFATTREIKIAKNSLSSFSYSSVKNSPKYSEVFLRNGEKIQHATNNNDLSLCHCNQVDGGRSVSKCDGAAANSSDEIFISKQSFEIYDNVNLATSDMAGFSGSSHVKRKDLSDGSFTSGDEGNVENQVIKNYSFFQKNKKQVSNRTDNYETLGFNCVEEVSLSGENYQKQELIGTNCNESFSRDDHCEKKEENNGYFKRCNTKNSKFKRKNNTILFDTFDGHVSNKNKSLENKNLYENADFFDNGFSESNDEEGVKQLRNHGAVEEKSYKNIDFSGVYASGSNKMKIENRFICNGFFEDKSNAFINKNSIHEKSCIHSNNNNNTITNENYNGNNSLYSEDAVEKFTDERIISINPKNQDSMFLCKINHKKNSKPFLDNICMKLLCKYIKNSDSCGYKKTAKNFEMKKSGERTLNLKKYQKIDNSENGNHTKSKSERIIKNSKKSKSSNLDGNTTAQFPRHLRSKQKSNHDNEKREKHLKALKQFEGINYKSLTSNEQPSDMASTSGSDSVYEEENGLTEMKLFKKVPFSLSDKTFPKGNRALIKNNHVKYDNLSKLGYSKLSFANCNDFCHHFSSLQPDQHRQSAHFTHTSHHLISILFFIFTIAWLPSHLCNIVYAVRMGSYGVLEKNLVENDFKYLHKNSSGNMGRIDKKYDDEGSIKANPIEKRITKENDLSYLNFKNTKLKNTKNSIKLKKENAVKSSINSHKTGENYISLRNFYDDNAINTSFRLSLEGVNSEKFNPKKIKRKISINYKNDGVFFFETLFFKWVALSSAGVANLLVLFFRP